MKIIAHRGASFEAPENTAPAFQLAWDLGADGVELDVQLTRDGRLVVLHDETTLRTTGRDLRVSHCDAADLRSLDAGAWKSPPWAGARLPFLGEVLDALPPGRELMIEIKGGTHAVTALREKLSPHAGRMPDLTLLSFRAATLAAAKRVLPKLRAFLNVEPPVRTAFPTRTLFESFVRGVCEEGLDGISFGDWPGLGEELVRLVKGAGLGVAVWTVDDPARASVLKSAGVDYLMTNDPRNVRA